MWKSLGASLAGLVLAFLAVAIAEAGVGLVYPFPSTIDPHVPEAMAIYIQTAPRGALAMVVVGWMLGGALGTGLSRWLAGQALPAYAVAALFLAACVWQLRAIPHPTWVWAFTLLGVPLACVVGDLVAGLGGSPPKPSSEA